MQWRPSRGLMGLKPTVIIEILHDHVKPSNLLDIMSMITDQAFKELINKRGISEQLGLNGGTFRNYRKWVNDNPDDPTLWKISRKKKQELLEIGGYNVIQEMLWK